MCGRIVVAWQNLGIIVVTSYTSAQIERFKREAKSLHRASAISHSQALDCVATANGYNNWSLLMKHGHSHGSGPLKAKCPPFIFNRTPAEMRFALRKVPESRGLGTPSRSDLAKERVDDISQAFASPQNAVTFAIDYMKCLLTTPRFTILSAAPVYWEMRSWLPYAFKELADGSYIVVNRSYKPVGQVSREWAKYEDFPHLHVHLTTGQCEEFTAPKASVGYLFNDGCPPWDSRADAVAYSDRLQCLCSVLKR